MGLAPPCHGKHFVVNSNENGDQDSKKIEQPTKIYLN
jgi:hypothetical protein